MGPTEKKKVGADKEAGIPMTQNLMKLLFHNIILAFMLFHPLMGQLSLKPRMKPWLNKSHKRNLIVLLYTTKAKKLLGDAAAPVVDGATAKVKIVTST